jgi:hypothetical protein
LENLCNRINPILFASMMQGVGTEAESSPERRNLARMSGWRDLHRSMAL